MKTKKVVGAVTLVGAGLLGVNSAMQLLGAKSVKGAVMPVVGLLVASAAIMYSLNDLTVNTVVSSDED